MDILNDRNQDLAIVWTGTDPAGNTVVVTPDSVDWTLSDGSLGSYTAADINTASFTPNSGALGDETFGAVSHQVGLQDFTAGAATGTLVNPPPPPAVQIDGGQVELIPQAGGSTVRATARRVQITGATVRRR